MPWLAEATCGDGHASAFSDQSRRGFSGVDSYMPMNPGSLTPVVN